VQQENTGVMLLEKIMKFRDVGEYSTYVESIANPVFRSIFREMVYPQSSIDELIYYIHETGNEKLFNLITGILAERELEDKVREDLIRMTDSRQNEKMSKDKSEIGTYFSNPINLYRHIPYLRFYDELSVDYIIGRILKTGNARLIAFLCRKIIDLKDEHNLLLADIAVNEGIIAARQALISLMGGGGAPDRKTVSALIDREDDEIWYTLVPYLKQKGHRWSRQLLSYLRRYGSDDVKKRISTAD
jgi:hypothetical protein